MTTTAQVEAFIAAYVHAWQTAEAADIAALFTAGAEYHEWPYETHWIGRAAIVEGWLSRQDWQEGGWSFESSILMITGDTAAVRGIGSYTKLGTFENLWTVTLDDDGLCTVFRMWNNEV